ncbi:MAG: ribokinase [Gordonia sp.]|jgi:ribokinase|uniref:ribokinase n=1 Tax=Gordonia sp. (in: high G+C Gram-positive bacteria) TaxID=84139 RepID=UPI000C422F44|nr:ribokinase [Gordonia sp. (in: high G+C Gram-positive bacteria)]MAU82603.1 ribokinase [Gordonia sp. (in: high G+C Gram-positive bacteria)]
MNSPVDVAVVGTLNVDVIIQVERMPEAGETIMGRSVSQRLGGKGANQALAAARHAPTALIGTVGDDEDGGRLLAAQRAGGVDVSHVLRAHEASGKAFIEVDDDGDNRIIVLAGANQLLTAEHVQHALDATSPAVVLTQLESPSEVTEAVADWCSRHDRRFLLNPSPVADLPAHVLAAADPLVVNEHEARFYAPDADDDPVARARSLLRVARSVVMTLGAHGVVVAEGSAMRRIDVEQVRAVDTTGAGDVFAGILGAHLASGHELVAAAELAAAAATEFVARPRQG